MDWPQRSLCFVFLFLFKIPFPFKKINTNNKKRSFARYGSLLERLWIDSCTRRRRSKSSHVLNTFFWKINHYKSIQIKQHTKIIKVRSRYLLPFSHVVERDFIRIFSQLSTSLSTNRKKSYITPPRRQLAKNKKYNSDVLTLSVHKWIKKKGQRTDQIKMII